MGIFDKVKKTTIASRRREEILYKVALEEVENDEIRKGLYAKALSKADGDKEKADGIYLKLRVQSIMDDIESEQINSREDARAYAAIQAHKEFESIEVKSGQQESLFDECKEMLRNKGYLLYKSKSKSGEYTIEIPATFFKDANVIYSSKDLNNIKIRASEIPNLL